MEEGRESDEKAWLAAAKRGEAAAFDRLVGLHLDRLYRFCRRILGDEADAMEVCMDTFLTAHRRLWWLRAKPSIGPWLFRTASRRCWRVLRRRQRRAEAERTVAEESAANFAPSPAAEAGARSEAEFLRACLNRLPERHRLPLVLRFVEEQEFEDVAKVLRCKPAMARLRVHRALKRFQKVYREYMALEGKGVAFMRKEQERLLL